MHELSLAVSLVDEVSSVLEREGGTKVRSVSVSIGALSGVEREPFEFCFPIAIENTLLEGAVLEVEEVAAQVSCAACGKQSSPEPPFLMCAECGSTDIRVVEGRDFLITSVEIE